MYKEWIQKSTRIKIKKRDLLMIQNKMAQPGIRRHQETWEDLAKN
jgi:hypothetical protein